MTTIARRFRILFVGVFIVCSPSSQELVSTTTAEKPVEESTTTTSTTTTTIPSSSTVELLGAQEFEEALIGELSVGDCYKDFRTNLDPDYFYEKVHKVPCDEDHNSEIVYKAKFSNQYLDVLMLKVEAGLRCNQARSLFDVIEFVDRKYETTFFRVESVFDETAVSLGDQDSIICSAYLEPVGEETDSLLLNNETFYNKENFDWSIVHEDLAFYIFDTQWDGPYDAGVVCQTSVYETDPFFSEFMMFYAIPSGQIEELKFVYENDEQIITIDLLTYLPFFSDTDVWDEKIFYYFLPVSQIVTFHIVNNFDTNFDPDQVFSAPAEDVIGTFSIKTSEWEKVSSCSMSEN